jgi:hypothetical protein
MLSDDSVIPILQGSATLPDPRKQCNPTKPILEFPKVRVAKLTIVPPDRKPPYGCNAPRQGFGSCRPLTSEIP